MGGRARVRGGIVQDQNPGARAEVAAHGAVGGDGNEGVAE